MESKEALFNILEMFSDKKIETEDEYTYRIAGKTDIKIQLPTGYSIAKVDVTFINQLDHGQYKNKKFLEERLLQSWGSYQAFFKKSLAFVILYQKRIVAVIIGTSSFNNIIPVDIETEEGHRKKGLASLLVQYFVNDCADNQLVVQWDCIDSNNASKKTAQKAGFVLLKKKPYYWFEI